MTAATNTKKITGPDGTIWYKNPFPDFVEDDWLTVDNFIQLLFIGMPYKDLPEDLASAVDAEMTKRTGGTTKPSSFKR